MGPKTTKGAGSTLDNEFDDEQPQWAQDIAAGLADESTGRAYREEDDDEVVHAVGCDRDGCDCGDDV